MRESIRERRAFARIAPRFVAPLAFVMPTSNSLTRHPLAMKAAFALDAFVGSDRNEGLPAVSPPAARQAHFVRRMPHAVRAGVRAAHYSAGVLGA